MSLSYLAAAPPEAILVEGQRPTPQFTFQRILTFSWVKALGPHKHMPNSLPMFAALIELTRLPGAGYRLHDWSTYPLLLTYSQRKQFYKIIRVLSVLSNTPFAWFLYSWGSRVIWPIANYYTASDTAKRIYFRNRNPTFPPFMIFQLTPDHKRKSRGEILSSAGVLTLVDEP